MSLYFVYLRQPGNIRDKRNDPYWEFGSFGKTGCHKRNLLHPKTRLQDSDRLVFIQGGTTEEGISEIRLIGVTPPIRVKKNPMEVLWDDSYRPIPYSVAPLLIRNNGTTTSLASAVSDPITDFPAVHHLIANVNKPTHCGAIGSRLRSRGRPVDSELAEQIIQYFSKADLGKIDTYIDAIQVPSKKWYCNARNLNWGSASSRSNAYYKRDMTSD